MRDAPTFTNHTGTNRELSAIRRWRCALLALGTLALLSAAQAVVPVPGQDPGCPFGATCFPGPGTTAMFDGWTGAADAAGKELHRRANEGDCTGLGPEGCLGVILHQILCAVDGRAWVQEACGGGSPGGSNPGGGDPGDGGGGADGGGADGGADGSGAGGGADAGGGDGGGNGDGGRGGDPEPTPQSGTVSAATFVHDADMNAWLRRAFMGHRGGPIHKQTIGETAYEVYLGGLYEQDPDVPTDYVAVLVVVNGETRQTTQIAMGAMGEVIYAGTFEFFRRSAR